ncbi:hypothetical protein ABIE89_004730 [Bradyrhizobium niftali]
MIADIILIAFMLSIAVVAVLVGGAMIAAR